MMGRIGCHGGFTVGFGITADIISASEPMVFAAYDPKAT
jgi:hypothetical protein